MCTLALYFQVLRDFPVIVAANRDEHYDRAARAPGVLDAKPRILAGTDERAGGTWLGINERGLLTGILNRCSDETTAAEPRSRGLLCLDVLACPNTNTAREYLATQQNCFLPFSLVFVDSEQAWLAFNAEGRIETRALTPGLHVFSNAAIHDDTSEKRQRAYALFAEAQPDAKEIDRGSSWIPKLQKALSDHSLGSGSDDPREAICVHGQVSGTVSSSIVLLSSAERRFRMFYCPGPPCQSCFGEAPKLDIR